MGNADAREQLEAAKAECVRLERELAAALAVIEKANRETDSYNPREAGGWQTVVDRVQDALATVDTSALAVRDAEKWDEGQQAEAAALFQDTGLVNVAHPVNPYRALAEGGENRNG